MNKKERERLTSEKAYLVGILKPCWIQGLIDKPTYLGLIKRMATANLEQIQKGIQMYKNALSAHHESKGQNRNNEVRYPKV